MDARRFTASPQTWKLRLRAMSATHAAQRLRIADTEDAKTAELKHLDTDLLRRRWRSVMGRPPPPHLTEKLLIRILLWREQIARVGDLDTQTLATLDAYAANKGDASNPAAPPRPGTRPGAVLVREHGGALHRVMVLQQGFAWNGKTFGSLSAVARAVTGTNWNGRRFFGLDKAEPVSKRISPPGGAQP